MPLVSHYTSKTRLELRQGLSFVPKTTVLFKSSRDDSSLQLGRVAADREFITILIVSLTGLFVSLYLGAIIHAAGLGEALADAFAMAS